MDFKLQNRLAYVGTDTHGIGEAITDLLTYSE